MGTQRLVKQLAAGGSPESTASEKAQPMSIPVQLEDVGDAREVPVAVGGVQLKRHSSFEQAEPLREEWDDFVQRVEGDLFTSFDWCATWWKYYGRGRRLELYLAFEDEELVAVLPLFRETVRWGLVSLRVVRIVGCDHSVTTCNVAIDPTRIGPVVAALMRDLARGGRWDMIHLGELPGYWPHGPELADAFRRCPEAGEVAYSPDDYPHMVFEVPATFDAFLAGLSLKERRNVRRDERKLEAAGRVERGFVAEAGELEEAFSRLVEMHTACWAEQGRLGHFGEWPQAEAFQCEVARRLLDGGRLVLVRVRINGECVAAEYGGRFGARVHWIVVSRRQEMTSRIGFCALLRSAQELGLRQIDALPGYYDYKRRLGAHTLGVRTITVLAPRTASHVRARLFRAVTRAIDVVYHRAWFWRGAPWIRRRFPTLRVGFVRAGLWPRYIRARFLVAARADAGQEALGEEVGASDRGI